MDSNKELLNWVNDEIDKIEQDERFHYEKARLDTNLPLALVQLTFDTRILALKEFKEKLEEQLLSETESRTVTRGCIHIWGGKHYSKELEPYNGKKVLLFPDEDEVRAFDNKTTICKLSELENRTFK